MGRAAHEGEDWWKNRNVERHCEVKEEMKRRETVDTGAGGEGDRGGTEREKEGKVASSSVLVVISSTKPQHNWGHTLLHTHFLKNDHVQLHRRK